MSWLFLSLVAAASLATTDALTKRFLSPLLPFEMGLFRLFYTLPWLTVIFLIIPWPALDRTFWWAVALSLPLEIAALLAYMKALKSSPLSLSLPFLAFTPLFVLLTGWVILGERVTLTGLGGILLILSGAYGLNLSTVRSGLLEPLKSIGKEPGSRLMLLVAFLYAFTSTLGKLAIQHSHPLFFPVIYYGLLCSVLALGFPFMPRARVAHLFRQPLIGLLIGTLGALSLVSHMLAISQIQVAYMVSVKRTSLLFGVLYGIFWFKEGHLPERLLAALLMMAGVFLIGWSG
jgi:drug/metabolite transporter (DMT)-like permease